VKHWDIGALDLEPHEPQILSTTEDSRAIVLALRAGEQLSEHQVHERAWIVVVAGEVDMGTEAGDVPAAGPGTLFEFAPQERHTVTARSAARLLILLTPWPGDGHPGAMTLEQKRDVRARAAEFARGHNQEGSSEE
jgi:quercetin dioxygenase-like cupin family protein